MPPTRTTPHDTPNEPRTVLRPEQLATRIGVSIKTLARWRCEGTGPTFLKLGPRLIGYDERDVSLWLDSRGADSTVAAREVA